MSVHEYLTFQYFLQDIEHLEEAVTEYRLIDRKTFKQILTDFQKEHSFCKTNPKRNCISDAQIEIFFDTLDLDNSSKLEYNEIMGILKTR